FFFFKQKTAYEISRDWSSDVCSSDLHIALARHGHALLRRVPLHFRRRRQDAQHFSGELERRMVGKGNGQQFAVLRDPKFLRRDHSGMSFPPPTRQRLLDQDRGLHDFPPATLAALERRHPPAGPTLNALPLRIT